MKTCSFENCSKIVRAKGLCKAHYDQQTRRGFLTPLLPAQKLIDLTGQTFGRLTVLDKTIGKDGRIYWICKCLCGESTIVEGASLRRGYTKSCGCFLRENSRKKATIHDSCTTRLYRIWTNMMSRCYKTYNSSYKYYGAKGIQVCKEWHIFASFKVWALSMGYTDNLTIDRINPKNEYSPSNCQWLTANKHIAKSWEQRRNYLFIGNTQPTAPKDLT